MKGSALKTLFSSQTPEWGTPQAFFDKLNDKYNFTLDPCGNESNHKCANYFSVEDDGLSQDWGGHKVFMNPPYGREISKWIHKAHEESLKPHTVIVCLIPARTDTKYWHEYCMEHAKEIHFVKGRLKFEGTSDNSAPFPSAVVVFDSILRYVFSNYPMVYTMEK
jgi:phage N-6-adenine-methyltransferase